MSSLITSKFGTINALNFENFITSVQGNTYITIGRAQAWSNNDTIPTPIDTANSYFQYWNDLIGLKRINSSDVNLVIPRVDWISGTIYTEYDPDTQLFYKTDKNNIEFNNSFYVRNSRDQVFKCIFNNNLHISTVMPEISIAGQLPENAYIETSDGYKWKYMYTIPYGLKEKFFTNRFMPIVYDAAVVNSAVDGRIDIIRIEDKGYGYNANASSNSVNILKINGNGSNANITVKVLSTSANGANIVDYNVINAGSGYTRASITINDINKIARTANANLIPVIGPPGGHGANAAFELGATNIMISVDIGTNEMTTLPVSTTGGAGFRQIGILNNPKNVDGDFVAGVVYRATTKYTTSESVINFITGDTVYVGNSLSGASFTAIVEGYDSLQRFIYLNNIIGDIATGATIKGCRFSNEKGIFQETGAAAVILSSEESTLKKYTGDLLYIENNSIITRSETETQQVKLTLRFN